MSWGGRGGVPTRERGYWLTSRRGGGEGERVFKRGQVAGISVLSPRQPKLEEAPPDAPPPASRNSTISTQPLYCWKSQVKCSHMPRPNPFRGLEAVSAGTVSELGLSHPKAARIHSTLAVRGEEGELFRYFKRAINTSKRPIQNGFKQQW